jgi:hypothetical protein
MATTNPHKPDWNHYRKHKERLDEQAKIVLERGDLENIGIPPGTSREIAAKALCTIVDKNPHVAKGTTKPDGKPMTGAEKRRQRKFDRDRTDYDEVIEVELKEGEGYKIIKNEDYVAPPPMRYKKDGKLMPEGWQPFKQLPNGPLPEGIKAAS